ncbi:MAG: hypothetical protein OXI33_11335 [Chloroflexota bacterium]|nr:hypothetical protein [Chloroflexota bacterium]
MKTILAFPFKAVYFVIRWIAYIAVFPFGLFSLWKRHSKKTRQKTVSDIKKAMEEADA